MTDILTPQSRAACAIRKPFILIGAVLAATLMVAGCSDGPTATKSAPELEPMAYQLGTGDLIRVEVFGDETLSSEQHVDGQGNLSLPLVGEVQAAGLSREELQLRIEEQMAEYRRNAEVTVNVLEHRPFYIVGEVQKPGGYPYVEGMTVINAIAMAGGYTYRARQDEYVVERESDQQAMRAGDRTRVLPGDIITVRERYF